MPSVLPPGDLLPHARAASRPSSPGRRRLVKSLALPLGVAGVALLGGASAARAAAPSHRRQELDAVLEPLSAAPQRKLELVHIHTKERLETVYWDDGVYRQDSLRAIDVLLRDWRRERARPIDPALLDQLWALQQAVAVRGPINVVCGYRTPETNAMLRRLTKGVAVNSLHIEGMAIDLRLPGCTTARLREAAQHLGHRGGVGYYPDSDFLHLDTGPARDWLWTAADSGPTPGDMP